MNTEPYSKLLIVDDDPNQVALLRRLFGLSYQLIEAQNGQEALTHVKSDSPALIILDDKLPDTNGLEVCQQIRAMTGIKQPQILMLTAQSNALDRVQALLVGANDYITKPFNAMHLISRVRALLYQH